MRWAWLASITLLTAACSNNARSDPAAPPPAAVVTSAPSAAPIAAPAPKVAPASGLSCAGAAAQGGLLVCRSWPRATLLIDGFPRAIADQDGWAVVGLDREAKPALKIDAQSAEGTASKTFAVAKRTFSIQRVDGLPPQTVTPTDPAVLAKIREDTAVKQAAFESRAVSTGFLDGLRWPVSGRMSGPWGNQRVLNGEPRTPHFGIDIAAPVGTPILAPAGGVVVLAKSGMHYEGGLVFVDHGQGLISMYLHMSRLDVRVGDIVAQGDSLGAVGASGRTTGPHLCWRMKWRERNVDPSLAVLALSTARAELGYGDPINPGAAPVGFVQWSDGVRR